LTTPRRRNWKRIAAWIGGGLLVLIASSVIGILALLHNDAFRQYLLRVALAKINAAAGTELKISNFSVRLPGFSPTVDLYDVVIGGAAPYQKKPFLKVDHVSVGIQVVSLMQRKWYFKHIVINHPVAQVFVGENGDNNLPKSINQTRSVFDIGVRHVKLNRGELYYNDKTSALDAEVRDLGLHSTFDPTSKKYSGALSYSDGKIHFRNFNPMVHSLQAEFDATADTFDLKHGLITSGASQLSLTATLQDYAHPKITGTYQSSMDTNYLRYVLKDATLPVGVVKLAGSVKFESDPDKPILETLTLDGNASSSGLQIHTAAIHTLVRNISAQYSLKWGDLEVHDLRAALLGGGMSGSFKMRDITGTRMSELHARLHDIALASLQALVNAEAMRDFRLTGTTNATVDANWRKAFKNFTAHTDADFNGTIGARNAAAQPISAEGSIHAGYSAGSQTVSFTRSYIRTPQTTINLDGTVSRTASLRVQVQSNDLTEVETAASAFGGMPKPLGLAGTATFAGTVSGSTNDPRIAGQFSAAWLKVKGTEWRNVRTVIDVSPSQLSVQNSDITLGNNRGRVTFNVNLGLDRWTFRDTSPFQIYANASQLNVDDLKRLAGVQAPVTGTLSLKISLHGSQLNPVGYGMVTLTEATIATEPVQSVNLDFQGTGDEVRGQARLRMAAGTAQSKFTYFPKRKAYDGDLQAVGIRLEQLHNLRARNLNIAGTLNVNARGSGTIDDPAVQFTAQIPQLQIQNQTMNGVTLQANIANRVADIVVDSQSQTLHSFVRGRGRVNLTGNFDTDFAFDTSAISLEPLIALYLPARTAGLTGQTEIHGTLKGPLKDKARLDAHITIPTLSVIYRNNVQFSAVQPVQLDYSNGVLTLQKTAIRGTATDLQLQGTIPVASNAPMSITALGTIDLGLGQMLDPDITSSGQLQFNVAGSGQSTDPNVQGQIKVVDATFAGGNLPLGLQNGNGVITLTNTRLEIDQFEGKVGGGTITATGGITYRPSVQFNVSVAGNGIRTAYPPGIHERLDTNLALVGSPQNAVLRGQVRLMELSFSPSFDVSDILAALTDVSSSTAPAGSFARNLQLDMHVVSTEDLNVRSSKLSVQGVTNLRIRATAAEPSIIGRVNITGGDLMFRGNRYVLEPGTLDFVDPYKIEPRVNLSVSTKVQDYEIRMLLRGTLDNLRTTYTSEPALPPSDIVNLLIFGQTTADQAINAPGSLSAESMIASSVSSEVTNRIEKFVGISQISIDPLLSGNRRDPSARITIQQRVTADLFVTFSTDASSTYRDVIKLEYQATPRINLSGIRDQNGGFAFDIRIKKTW
jgi:translocation and assembly module TamB